MVEKVNVAEKFSRFDEHWSPRQIAELNDTVVKAAKLKGEFVWHHHEHEDELFLVVKGTLRILLRDGEIVLNEGEMVVIPRGVEHLPIADEEAHVLLVEPRSTLNTGNLRNERTVEHIPVL
ncbi:MAG TPA: cupin domain-containing protein [Longimicrobium sp.]|nr:cupin domain-containing protein [Longimicrobium sp.]